MRFFANLGCAGLNPANSSRNLLHAPNVHVGGGLVLLQQLLAVRHFPFAWVQLDERIQELLQLPGGVTALFVRPSFWSRALAELRLWRETRPGDRVLCFHGLPPLFPLRGRVTVFLQNRLLVEPGSLASYSLRVRLRLGVERFWSRVLQGRVTRYVVQTPSMSAAVKRWLQHDITVSVLPFSWPVQPEEAALPLAAMERRFDFVYVASGEPHKNHRNLLAAWRLLKEAGHRPSLALTLDHKADPELTAYITQYAAAFDLDVANLGVLSRDRVVALYRSARAMIFPSTTESLGLPLIEASQYRLPILAPELDYVRDVVEPVETFDPASPTSIARAVKRFLGAAERPVVIGSGEEFLAEVCR